MEIKFELTTEPACKTAIALGAFAGITPIISDLPNAFRIGGCILIGVLALIIGTYTTSPLRSLQLTTMLDTVSSDSIRDQMLHATLMRINGEPTHKLLKILEKELAANLMAIPCPWGHDKGHLGLLQDPVLYLQCNGTAFTIPLAALPDYPINPPTAVPARKAA
jgi:hypothetical protein